MKNNVYRGRNAHDVTVNGKPLNPRLDIRNHSPTGFSWGYGGSGPAQLALAIMVNEYGKDTSKHPVHYQDFKWRVIGAIKGDEFQFTTHEVMQWVERLRAEKEERD